MVAAAVTPLPGCAPRTPLMAHCSSALCDFTLVKDFSRLKVFRTGPGSGPAVILLHELPGMSPPDMALARCLAREQFTVYMPLLFGEPGQNSVGRGYFQSCWQDDFACSKLSTRSPMLDRLAPLCQDVAKLGAPVGVIGMCLTGVFPLALVGEGIQAAVICQPTVPFNALLGRPLGEQKRDLGLSAEDLKRALTSTVPVLALRYAGDTRCPPERMRALGATFGRRLARIELSGPGHSTLAVNFDHEAFADTTTYLKVVLGIERGPRRMSLARLGEAPCEITAERRWRAI